VLFEPGEIGERGFERRKIEQGGASGRGVKQSGGDGYEESASLRMSLQAPARPPDRIRHVAKPHPSSLAQR
jgi:hypothetical protein